MSAPDRPPAEAHSRSATPDFLRASELPRRWQLQERFVLLDTAFGTGQRCLTTWAAWRADPQRSRRLDMIAIADPPPSPDQLQQAHREGANALLASELAEAWPALTPNLHRLVFDGGRVQLLLLPGPLSAGLAELVASVDAFVLEAVPSDRTSARGQSNLCKALARLAAPAATLFCRETRPGLREALVTAGFVLQPWQPESAQDGPTLARHAPAFVARRPPARQPTWRPTQQIAPHTRRDALVVGAGLAGCACAAALAGQGWQPTLIDRQAEPASEASGNPGGLFHGVVHAGDGTHARFIRACALETTRQLRDWLAKDVRDSVDSGAARRPGASMPRWAAVDGLLRLEGKLGVDAMRRQLQQLALPAGFVQALDANAASRLAGMELKGPAWFYPGGGWAQPAALASRWLAEAGPACRFIGGQAVQSLRHADGEWQALAADGRTIAAAAVLVLANAADAARLLDGGGDAALDWPFEAVRGQISLLDDAARHGLPLPRLPLAGTGYLLPAIEGMAVFGATAQRGDTDPSVRPADHALNLARLAQLSPALAVCATTLPAEALHGRTAWRCVSRDRLPLIGAVPDVWVGGKTGDWDQPRFVPRAPGLFMATALGSRGISSAGLGAQVLAALVSGASVPLEAGLIDAIDPARFVARASRRAAAEANAA